MYILRDPFHTYELWDPHASRRVTASWIPLGPLHSLRDLAERLARDEDNLRIMTRLATEHGGRRLTTEAVAERFASLLHSGRLVLRQSVSCPYPLPDPRVLETPVGLAELAEPEPAERLRAVVEPPRDDEPLYTARTRPAAASPLRMHRVQTDVLHTRPGSALLVPSPATDGRHPLEAVMTALDWLAAHPREVMVLVGHRSPDDPPEATALGRDRATALHAILTGDRATWVSAATRAGGPTDVQHLLRYLARRRRWDCDLEPIDGQDSPAHREAVRRFQAGYNERVEGRILEDGICGRQTLGALFDVLHDELSRWIDKHGLSAAALRLHPHTPVLDGGLDWAGHPRLPPTSLHLVDLLLLDPGPLGLSRPLVPADLYEHPLATIDTLPVVHEPGDWEHGRLTVVTDLGPAYVEIHEVYRLWADDGSFDVEIDTAIEGVLDDGAIEARFEGIPVGPRYSLTVTNAAGQTFTLFTGLRYDQFHPRAIGEQLDEPATPAAA